MSGRKGMLHYSLELKQEAVRLVKAEYLRHFKKPSFEEAQQLIAEYIYFYNYEKVQLKTRQTPFELRCLSS